MIKKRLRSILILLCTIVSISLISCKERPKDTTFTLEIRLNDLDESKDYQWYFTSYDSINKNYTPVNLATGVHYNLRKEKQFVTLSDGKLVIEGKLDRPKLIYLNSYSDRSIESLSFMLDYGKQTIEATLPHLKNYTYTGNSKEQALLTKIRNNDSIKEHRKQIKNLNNLLEEQVEELLGINNTTYKKLRYTNNQKDKAKGKAIMDSVNGKKTYDSLSWVNNTNRKKYLRLSEKVIVDFVKKHPSSYAGLDMVLREVFLRGTQDPSYINMKPYIEAFGENIKSTPEYAMLNKRYEKEKKLAPGMLAPDIKLPTPEGDTLSISDFKGKVVILDFWASWCHWCRKETPNLKELYKKYKDSGLEVLAISFDDNEKDYREALKHDDMPWPQIWDSRGIKNSGIRKLYPVQGIPYMAILDREGKIVATRVRRPGVGGYDDDLNMNKHLERIFGF